MPPIRPIAQIGDKWARVTPQRTQDFIDGVLNPRADWAQATAAANDIYVAGVTAAATAGRFRTGVTKAGTAKWQEHARRKGASRFPEGVALGEPDYEAGFAPFAEVIARTALPPRRARGDPGNIERTRVMAAALRAAAVGATTPGR